MTVQEAISKLLEAASAWIEKTFSMDSGIMKAIEDIIQMIVSSYVDA